MQKRTIALPCAIPGTETTVTAFCYGPQDAQRHIYLQGSLHADEMPGSLVAYHLCQRLDKLEAQGALQARITVVPLCNTAGLRQSVLFSGVGRFDMAIGQNYNRLRTVPFYERVLARLQQNPQALGQDAQANRTTIRAAMRAEAQAWQPTNAIEALHSVLLQLETRPGAWSDWFAGQGIAPPEGQHGMMMDQFSMMIQAAIAGLGVALLPSYLAQPEIDEGRLQPILRAGVPGEGAYWLAWPDRRQSDPAFARFRTWIADQVTAG